MLISVWALGIHVPLSTTKMLVLKLGLQACLCASTLDQQLAGTNQTNPHSTKKIPCIFHNLMTQVESLSSAALTWRKSCFPQLSVPGQSATSDQSISSSWDMHEGLSFAFGI